MEQQHRLRDDSSDLISNPDQYRRLVGCLIYLTIIKPKLCSSVHILSQFLQALRRPHWDAAIQVLRYIKHCPRQEILLQTPTSLTL